MAFCTGWLEKKGYTSFVVDSWENRYFIFDPNTRTLKYGATENEAQRNPRGVCTINAVNDVADRGGKRQNRIDFAAHSHGKGSYTLSVSAPSFQEKSRWMATTGGGARRQVSGLGLLQAAMPAAAVAPPPMAAVALPPRMPMAAAAPPPRAPAYAPPPQQQQQQWQQPAPAYAPQQQQFVQPPPPVFVQQAPPVVVVSGGGGGYNPGMVGYGAQGGMRGARMHNRMVRQEIRREERAAVGVGLGLGALAIGLGMAGGGGHHHHRHGHRGGHHHGHRGGW